MSKAKSQYINLASGSNRMADNAERKYTPETRTVHLSGKRWAWAWKRPTGITIEKGHQKKRVPILDLTRIVQALFYAVSLVLGMIGVILMIEKQRGEQHG